MFLTFSETIHLVHNEIHCLGESIQVTSEKEIMATLVSSVIPILYPTHQWLVVTVWHLRDRWWLTQSHSCYQVSSRHLPIAIRAPFCILNESTPCFHHTWGLQTLHTSVCQHCAIASRKHSAGNVDSTERMGRGRRSCYWVEICTSLPPLSQNFPFHGW